MQLLPFTLIALAKFATLTTGDGLCKKTQEEYYKIYKKDALFPECDENGNFEKIQYIAGWEFCVDPVTGRVIPGYARFYQFYTPMNCECAIKSLKDKKIKCQSNGNEITTCLSKVYSYKHLYDTTPWCDSDGNYHPVQCDKKRCECVSTKGTQLSDPITGRKYASESLEDTNDMRCNCAVAQHESSKPKTFFCNRMGNYYASTCATDRAKALLLGMEFAPVCNGMGEFDRVQCLKDRCFCADKHNGRMIGHYMFKKDCYVHSPEVCLCARHEHEYKKYLLPKTTKCLERGNYEPCVIKRLKSETLNHTTPTETSSCDCVGDFQPVQCNDKMCYCVNKYGTHLGKYENGVCLKDKMSTCQCARDQDEAILTGNNNKLFFCDRYGNY